MTIAVIDVVTDKIKGELAKRPAFINVYGPFEHLGEARDYIMGKYDDQMDRVDHYALSQFGCGNIRRLEFEKVKSWSVSYKSGRQDTFTHIYHHDIQLITMTKKEESPNEHANKTDEITGC